MFIGHGLVPLYHVMGEIAAAPFAEEWAFRNAVTELDPTSQGSSKGLWQRTERRLREQAPGYKLDELTALRDRIWFDELSPSVKVAELRRHYADRLALWMSREGRHVDMLSDVHNAVGERLALRWLRMSLPPEYSCVNGVSRSHPALAQILARGFAECHLHLGGALRFTTAWKNLALRLPRTRPSDWPDGHYPFGSCEEFLTALTCAAIAEAVIDVARQWDVVSGLYARMTAEAERLGILGSNITDAWSCITALEIGRPGNVARTFAAHALAKVQLLRERCGLGRVPESSISLEDVALRTLSLAKVALQAERLRVMYYRFVVQRPLTPGLQHFVRHFDRLRPVKKGANLIAEAMILSGAGQGLESLELRLSPDKGMRKIREDWDRLSRQIEHEKSRCEPPIDVHVVVHFVRDRGGGQRSSTPAAREIDTKGSPLSTLLGWRYSAYREDLHQEVLALRSLLETSTSAAKRIRALDLCTDEAGIPMWASAGPIVSLRKMRPKLRMTVHCGEDFVHLLSGLRRVWEAVTKLDLREGDRLGHALALGIDCEKWSDSDQLVTMRIEERMWDLVWAWSFLRTCSDTTTPAALVAEAERHARVIFGDESRVTIHDLSMLYDDLFSTASMSAIGYPGRPFAPPREAHRAFTLSRYLRDYDLFLRGQEVIVKETARDVPVLRQSQSALRQLVSRCGLSIEVNISSNLLVGNLLQKKAHPLWRFRSPDRTGVDEIGVVLGSDDPLTFATTLPDEYQLAHDLLVNDGIAPIEVLEWLNRVRRHGLSSSF